MNPNNFTADEITAAKKRKGFFLRRNVDFRLLSIRLDYASLPNEIKQFFSSFTCENLEAINLAFRITTFDAEVPAYLDHCGLYVAAHEADVHVGEPYFDPHRNQRTGNGGQLFTRVDLGYELEGVFLSVWSGVMAIYSQHHPRSYLKKNRDRKKERHSVKAFRVSPPRRAVMLQGPSSPAARASGNPSPSSPLPSPPVSVQPPSSEVLQELFTALHM